LITALALCNQISCCTNEWCTLTILTHLTEWPKLDQFGEQRMRRKGRRQRARTGIARLITKIERLESNRVGKHSLRLRLWGRMTGLARSIGLALIGVRLVDQAQRGR
jgi:hypothetical protein